MAPCAHLLLQGTNDKKLVRVIVSRSEIDLADASDAYLRLYHKTLAKAIKEDCGGDYERILVDIVT